MHRIKFIHFVGIGGAGMSGIAEVLLNQGYKISGSDKQENNATRRLAKLGAKIFYEHDAKNIDLANVLVTSSAIALDNPEVIAARKLRIPVIPRAQMLAELMRFHHGIAIAGTHGKTTTTSLIASLLSEGGLDPTFVIGGLLNSAGVHARLGQSRYFIAEADESDASFLCLSPTISVITNIDADHMLTYDNDFQRLKQAFLDFIHRLPFYGLVIVCIDDPVIKEILPQIARSVITYGFDKSADIRALEFVQSGITSIFKVQTKDTELNITLNLPGRHNALNALAAIAVGIECKIKPNLIAKSLQHFKGVGRRFDIRGELAAPNVLVIDDYGHHPREIQVTLEAIKAAWPKRRLVLAFQPHRYTRTQALFDDFVKILATADELLLLEIYPASETPIPGISSHALAERIKQLGKITTSVAKDIDQLLKFLKNVLHDNDILLLQGAGNIGSVSQKLINVDYLKSC